jgi:HEAT repeat protein
MTSIHRPDPIELNIRKAAYPSGDPVHLKEREQAVRYLLAHADNAYAQIEQRIRDKPEAWETPRLIEVLGRFGHPASIPLLESLLLSGIADTSRAAGRALGMIDDEAAKLGLAKGLQAESIEVRIAAVEGARIDGANSWCRAIEPLLAVSDANLRYYVINAAAELGCLNAERLRLLAEGDQNPNVRRLAIEWLKRSGAAQAHRSPNPGVYNIN